MRSIQEHSGSTGKTCIGRSGGRWLSLLVSAMALSALTIGAGAGCVDAGEPEFSEQVGELRRVDDARPRRCTYDDECGRGRTCDKPGCHARDGVCVAIPRACPDVWQPECGCDGRTYGNSCERIAAGVDLAHPGECGPQTCGPTSARCGRGEVCIYKTGVCGQDDGICLSPPQGCPRIWAPVCGCNGKTYGNECEAHAAGVSVLHEGACRELGCSSNAECGREQYCAFPDGMCGEAMGIRPLGQCEARPRICPMVYKPVCGCDGQTYDNECVAAMNGVTVKSEGACRCDGRTGNTCDDNEFCDHDPGTCHIRDAEGSCVEVSDYCLAVYDPVCGCDGVTYSNDCDRIQNRAQKLHHGPCEATGCQDNGDCSRSQFCAKSGCQGTGTCEPRPEACIMLYAPVCGCDGVTYSNACFAASAGVNVASQGECEARCGGILGVGCGEGQLCDLDPGSCQVSDAQGMCVSEPGGCLDVWMPVCGCDGVTYSNDCYRLLAGASKDRDGECGCAPVLCDLYCQWGYAKGEDGCETCRCNPPPRDECPPVCAIACQYGNVLDENGCPTCACNPPPVDGPRTDER